MPYTVSSYDNYDIPEPCWVDHGTFESPADAVACANRIVRSSLEALYVSNRKPAARVLYGAYLEHGEVPAIFGEPELRFDPYVAVEWEIRKLTGERQWSNGDYLRCHGAQ